MIMLQNIHFMSSSNPNLIWLKKDFHCSNRNGKLPVPLKGTKLGGSNFHRSYFLCLRTSLWYEDWWFEWYLVLVTHAIAHS